MGRNRHGTFKAPFYTGSGLSPASLVAEALHGQSRYAGTPDLILPDAAGYVEVILNTKKK